MLNTGLGEGRSSENSDCLSIMVNDRKKPILRSESSHAKRAARLTNLLTAVIYFY